MERGKSVTELRKSNRSVILALLARRGPLTKNQLSDLSCLSRATVLNILDDLMSEKIVILDSKSKSSGGRQPQMYNLNPRLYSVIGLDIRVDTIKGVITDLRGNILAIQEQPSDYLDSDQRIFESARAMIQKLLDNPVASRQNVIGIGISYAGIINNKNGEIYYSPNIGGVGFSFKKEIGDYFGLPVFADKDANLAAYAEYCFGLAKDHRNVLFVFADHGTGAGLVINGEIYRGANHSACEFGHSSININGKKCHCGKFGCVETYTSFDSIISRFKETVCWQDVTSTLRDNFISNQDNLTVHDIIAAASKDDVASKMVLEETGRILGIACGNLVDLYDPDIIVLGGGLMKAGYVLIDPLKRLIHVKSIKSQEQVKVVVSKLEPNACVIGAVTLVIKAFLGGKIELSSQQDSSVFIHA